MDKLTAEDFQPGDRVEALDPSGDTGTVDEVLEDGTIIVVWDDFPMPTPNRAEQLTKTAKRHE